MSGQFRKALTRRVLIAAVAVSLAGLAGCAAPIVAGLTAAQVFTIAGISATIMTGRDITEHAVSMVTGKDCRFLETLLRNGRSFCETPDTIATKDDFQGVIALLETKTPDSTTKVAAAALDPQILGFAPVDRRAAEDFSLEIARKDARVEASMLSFGMLSATFGSSFSYELNMRGSLADAAQPGKLALALPAPAKPNTGIRPTRADYPDL